MPPKPNKPLRLAIPIIAAALGLAVVASVAINTNRHQPAANETDNVPEDVFADAGTTGEDDAPPQVSEPAGDAPSADTADPAAEAAQAADATVAAPTMGPGPESETTGDEPAARVLRARPIGDPGAPLPALGSIEEGSDFTARIEFTRAGAGVSSMTLAEYFKEVDHAEHVVIQSLQTVDLNSPPTDDPSDDLKAVPFALLGLEVNGQAVNLAVGTAWRPIEGAGGEAVPGAFEAIIEDDAGDAVVRVERRFSFEAGSFDIKLDQRAENLSGEPLSIRWIQTGAIDLPEPAVKYGGEKRRVRFGYLLNEQAQANAIEVSADTDLINRMTYMGKQTADANGVKRFASAEDLWPTKTAKKQGHRLVWVAFSNRYFGVAIHPRIDPSNPGSGGQNYLFDEIDSVERLVLKPYAQKKDPNVVVMRLTTKPQQVAPGATASADLGIYAGPLLPEVFDAEPVAQALNLRGLIAYSHGGMCAFCTFEWLTHLLLWVLNAFHAVTADWALAIVLLVIAVRGCLHPITRWSQIRMQRFGAQMQAIAPKQQKIKEKFKNDPQRMQQEMAKIWKEEGINPAGMLGCLPMFLQSPVWIALYAVLFFAAELRHEPAFYGVFQTISGGNWKFLADLASPDRALPLPSFLHFTPPLLGDLYGTVKSINLLPLLLGVVFFLQQKYLTPPTTGTMTPEQESMQRTMKIMTVVMFPLFMYTAPSGLSLYFITNSTLGILEARWIRSHATKHGLLDPEKIKAEKAAKRKNAKGGGFMARLQAAAEAQQQLKAQQQAGGRKQVSNTARRPEPPNRQYKKRR